MCGFVGILDPRGVPDHILLDMTQALAHRGPDDLGLVCFDRDARQFIELNSRAERGRRCFTAMGFRRLSIPDTSHNNHQPMLSQDRRYAITFNGEIYNFQELRSELITRGYRFRSQTDTEVLLCGFMVENLPQVTWHNDFPLGLPNCLGIYLLAQTARRYVSVLLSGEGADEVFGGYRRFYYAAWLARLGRIPGLLRLSGLERKLPQYGGLEQTVVGLSAFGNPALIGRIYPAFSLEQALVSRLDIWRATQDGTLLERLLTYEQRTYLVELLLRQDKMCIAHSVENRVPLVDHRIVELAKQIPTVLKVSTSRLPRGARGDYCTKRVLKEMAAHTFGQSFAYRPKAVFALPLQELGRDPSIWRGVPKVPNCAPRPRRLRPCRGRRPISGRAGYGRPPCAELLWNVVALAAWWLVFGKRPAMVP
jgi:asparagine synthetase B (glutamine-hydrolysing)